MAVNEFYLTQIAKLYYIDKVRQNEIAKRFGVTPMMVSRYLREAEQRGLVTVHVKTQWPMDMQLGKRLMEAYGLQECIVLAPNEGADVQYVLGGFLADYFTSLVKPGMIVGISWGKTISKFVEQLPFNNVEKCRIVQLSGAFVGQSYEVTPSYIVQEAPKRLNARVYTLNAPLYVASEEVKRLLLEDPTNKLTHTMAEQSSINIIGASCLAEDTTTFRSEVISQADFEELSHLGAVGDCAGIFLDAAGRQLEWSRKKLYTGVPLETIQKADHVICVAGEPQKQQVLRLSAKKKYFNILITTKKTAERMLL